MTAKSRSGLKNMIEDGRFAIFPIRNDRAGNPLGACALYDRERLQK